MKTVTIEGREVPLIRPDEQTDLDKHEALMLRLGGERHLSKEDMRVMIVVGSGCENHTQYHHAVFEAVLALAAEMYDFHPDENPPPECPGEDYQIVLEALRRIKQSHE